MRRVKFVRQKIPKKFREGDQDALQRAVFARVEKMTENTALKNVALSNLRVPEEKFSSAGTQVVQMNRITSFHTSARLGLGSSLKGEGGIRPRLNKTLHLKNTSSCQREKLS